MFLSIFAICYGKQTCSMGYNKWPKTFLDFFSLKFKLWLHQNGENCFFTFWVKRTSSERASEEEQNTENRFSMRHVWAELVRPGIHSFS